ncbi:MAG: sulfatase [Pseudomonadales bacterium]|nr:sulfatase [Pseudomonadales bacterium]
MAAPIAEAETSPSKPNVVLFFVDDLGWSDVASYGSSFYETPNIDALAKDGVRFTDAYATSHVCSPSRASLITGKYPARLGLTDWLSGRPDRPFQKLQNAKKLQALPQDEYTLAEALKAQGYSTAMFGKWHLGEAADGPLSQGFDEYVPKDWYKGWPKAGYFAPFQMDGLDSEEGAYLTDRLTDEALAYIESNKDNPFFLYLSHFAVHDPVQGRTDLVDQYEEKLSKMPEDPNPVFILEGNPDDVNPLSREELNVLINEPGYEGQVNLPRRTVKISQRQDNVEFAGMVESMDESLGRVRAKLTELGIADNTIIIFFSDNGGMAGKNARRPDKLNKQKKKNLKDSRWSSRAKVPLGGFSTSNLPLRGAKGWLYEGGIRVPLIVRSPNQTNRGTVSAEPVIGTDIYPTILELAGLPMLPEQHVDGVSIAPLLTTQGTLDRDAIFWHFPHYSNHGNQSPGGAVRSGDYKLLEYFENGTVQLFNLREDIGEQNDLSRVEPEHAAKLREKLDAWRSTVSANMMLPNPEYAP